MNKYIEEDLDSFIQKFIFIDKISHKTILITGATGLIGSFLIRALLKLNEVENTKIKIYGLVRNKDKIISILGNVRVHWIIGDIREKIKIDDRIDYVIHCANPTSSNFFKIHPVETLRIITEGTQNLLDFSRDKKVKSFVYVSSLEVYGIIEDDTVYIDENSNGYINQLDVRSSYSLGKRTAECLSRCYFEEYGLPVKIARLTQTFGAGVLKEDNRVFAQFARCIIDKKDIVLHTSGESAKPYCYTVDAILAIFYILFNGIDGEAYNVANSSTHISIKDLAYWLIKEFAPELKVKSEIQEDKGYAPITKLKLNTTKLEKLGWSPYYNLYTMYNRLLNYFKS